jgi:hypothetical protein
MVQRDHGVEWSCTSLRKVLGRLCAGMAPHREEAQVDQLVRWLEQARASKGRFRPTLSVGRDGIFVPLRHGVWQEGATATISVLDRRGKRVGTVYLGQRPEAGQGTLTDQLSGLLKALVSRIDSESLRLVSGSDEGHHPSTYYHRVLKKMVDPRRPWRALQWIRVVDFYGCNRSLPKSLCRQLSILRAFSRSQLNDGHRLGCQVPLMDLLPDSTQLDHPQVQNHLTPRNRP